MLLVCLIFAIPAATRPRAAARLPFSAVRILWIAAHPDDEALIAPLLGPLCAGEPRRCSILVLTRGEAGSCALPGGCGDLGALRSAEMQSAAIMLGAALTQWSLPDRMDGVETAWPHAEVVARLHDFITAAQPTVVFTFDPAHGSTGHPAHRLTGALVTEAAGGIPLFYVETVLAGEFRFSNADPRSFAFDAAATWDYLLRDVAIHASQFTEAQRGALASTPGQERRVYIRPR